MKLLQNLLSLKQPVAENQDEWEAMHAAQSDEFHSHERRVAADEIASADEFTVEREAGKRVMVDDMVHLLDGERTVRVSMPYYVWLQLCQETVNQSHGGGHEDR